MFLNNKYKIIAISLIAVCTISIVSFYFYGQYNLSKTQNAINTSLKHQQIANNYSLQAEEYEKKNDYENAILMRQKSLDELSQALNIDVDVSLSANGIYKDYIDNDILLLKMMSQLTSLHIQFDKQKNGEFVADTADYTLLNVEMTKLKNEISIYQNKKSDILSQNPHKFNFLK